MRNRIVTAVKQRFSIRKLSIGAASVLLGTSLYFMGASAPVVHAATGGESAAVPSKVVPSKVVPSTENDADPVHVAGKSTMNDADVNNAIDKYAEDALEHGLKNKDNKVIIRPSDKQPVTVYKLGERVDQVRKIKDKINSDIEQANKDNESIEKYKNDHPQTVNLNDKDSISLKIKA